MTRDEVLARLAGAVRRPESCQGFPQGFSTRSPGDGRIGIPSAVLVPLVDRPDGLSILLTRRTEHLASHRGQVCFPGGRVEPDDVSPIATALREAAEETGLDPDAVRPIGCLDDYPTVTGYLVTPVIGLVRPPLQLTAQPEEVAGIFEVPLAYVLDPAHHRRLTPAHPSLVRTTYAVPYQGDFIWGATAAMLINLYRILTRPGGQAAADPAADPMARHAPGCAGQTPAGGIPWSV